MVPLNDLNFDRVKTSIYFPSISIKERKMVYGKIR